MITVVVVYNDLQQLDSLLRASLARQRAAFELITVDNREHQYRSAAAALNCGATSARGDVLFFAHQDVSFDSPTWLEDAERMINEAADVGIAGVAGARPGPQPDTRIILSNIADSIPPQRDGHVSLTEPQVVETVDECAFFVPRTVFERFRFDEEVCRDWHLYAVEFALSVRNEGWKVYALPLSLHHRSGGAVESVLGVTTYEHAYFATLKRVVRKHAAKWPRIYTTCGVWSTRTPVVFQRFNPTLVRDTAYAWLRRLRRPGL